MKCPHCMTEISGFASRCPHCTSEIDGRTQSIGKLNAKVESITLLTGMGAAIGWFTNYGWIIGGIVGLLIGVFMFYGRYIFRR